MLSFPWLAKRMRAGEGNPHGFQSGGGHQRKAPVLRNPCSVVKTEHTCDPLHPRQRLELCHQCMSSSAQKVEASISSMGIRDGCSAKDPRCPTPHRGGWWGLQGAVAATVCAQDLEMSLPYLQRRCQPFYRHHGLCPGIMKGDKEEKMGKQHEDVPCGYFPALPYQHLAACCSRGAPVSLGFGQGGDVPPALLSPSLPPLVTVPWNLWALPCPRDRRDVRALRPPGMMRLFSPTSQHVRKTGKGTSFSWPRLWRLGCSFGGAKSCEG